MMSHAVALQALLAGHSHGGLMSSMTVRSMIPSVVQLPPQPLLTAAGQADALGPQGVELMVGGGGGGGGSGGLLKGGLAVHEAAEQQRGPPRRDKCLKSRSLPDLEWPDSTYYGRRVGVVELSCLEALGGSGSKGDCGLCYNIAVCLSWLAISEPPPLSSSRSSEIAENKFVNITSISTISTHSLKHLYTLYPKYGTTRLVGCRSSSSSSSRCEHPSSRPKSAGFA